MRMKCKGEFKDRIFYNDVVNRFMKKIYEENYKSTIYEIREIRNIIDYIIDDLRDSLIVINGMIEDMNFSSHLKDVDNFVYYLVTLIESGSSIGEIDDDEFAELFGDNKKESELIKNVRLALQKYTLEQSINIAKIDKQKLTYCLMKNEAIIDDKDIIVECFAHTLQEIKDNKIKNND